MLIIEVGAAAPGGYVRAVFSRRVGGFAAPLDLMRAHLRAVGVRRRCRAAFADYLVTDSDDLELRALEAVPVPAFYESRGKYTPKNDAIAMTAYGPWLDELQSVFHPFDVQGSLDAPQSIAAGAMRRFGASCFLPALAARA